MDQTDQGLTLKVLDLERHHFALCAAPALVSFPQRASTSLPVCSSIASSRRSSSHSQSSACPTRACPFVPVLIERVAQDLSRPS